MVPDYVILVYIIKLTCKSDHHVVEDDRHTVVEQGLTKHHEVQVRIHPNLPNRVKIFTPTYQTGLIYSLQSTKQG